jgi:hypothetical protein
VIGIVAMTAFSDESIARLASRAARAAAHHA